MKRVVRLAALAVASMILAAPAAAATSTQVLFDAGARDGVSGLRVSDLGWVVAAADFQVSGSVPVTRADVWTTEFPGMFQWSGTVNYYVLGDAGGSPAGPPLYSGVGVSPTRVADPLADCCGYDEFRYSFAFQSPLVLQPGVRYWLAVNIPGGGTFSTTQAFWASAATTFGNTARITGDPNFTSWGEYFFDLAFRLYGDVTDTTPPTIAAPTAVVADATQPAGAAVAYTATAADDVDPAPTLVCTPASGTTFAIGDTTVACTASDSSGNVATASFVVHVRGAREQLVRLEAAVTGVGPGMSLADTVAEAIAALDAGDAALASATLGELVDLVTAQSGKKIQSSDAASLIDTAMRIRSVLS